MPISTTPHLEFIFVIILSPSSTADRENAKPLLNLAGAVVHHYVKAAERNPPPSSACGAFRCRSPGGLRQFHADSLSGDFSDGMRGGILSILELLKPPRAAHEILLLVDPRASGGDELESTAVSAEGHARWKITAPLKLEVGEARMTPRCTLG